jgi:hypothetical protein
VVDRAFESRSSSWSVLFKAQAKPTPEGWPCISAPSRQ